MEKTICITVKDKIAQRSNDVTYTCGNSDYNIAFDFDDEWAEYETKTALFVYNGQKTPVVFTGNTCAVPIISNVYQIKVGVFAGNLHTTTPAIVYARKSILCEGGTPADPPDDVYNQIMERLNNLGTPDPEAIAAAVADYIAANPIEETDPTVHDWAKAENKPTYTADEVGADASGTAETKISAHNTETTAHSDIRLLISGLTDRLNALADSDDTTLDQLSEIVTYIKSNKSLIDAITTSKVSVDDIIDNLTTNVSNKPLSAAQGVALKALIDGITIPETLPNPNALTFTGAVEGSYDGSEAVTVEIPSGGGGGGFEVLVDFTTEEAVTEFTIPATVLNPLDSKIKEASILIMQLNIPRDTTDESITTTGTVAIEAFIGWSTNIIGGTFNAITAPSETYNNNWVKNVVFTKVPESVSSAPRTLLIQIFGKRNNSNADSLITRTVTDNFYNFNAGSYIIVKGSQTMAAGTRFIMGVIA